MKEPGLKNTGVLEIMLGKRPKKRNFLGKSISNTSTQTALKCTGQLTPRGRVSVGC